MDIILTYIHNCTSQPLTTLTYCYHYHNYLYMCPCSKYPHDVLTDYCIKAIISSVSNLSEFNGRMLHLCGPVRVQLDESYYTILREKPLKHQFTMNWLIATMIKIEYIIIHLYSSNYQEKNIVMFFHHHVR